jgi:hypothetical protein
MATFKRIKIRATAQTPGLLVGEDRIRRPWTGFARS